METKTKYKEKRAHRRLDIRLPLEYRRQDMHRTQFFRTMTINVSTGGIYFETSDEDICPGDKLIFEVGVPPGDKQFPQEGKISTVGEVLRAKSIKNKINGKGVQLSRYGVAAKFEQGFKLIF